MPLAAARQYPGTAVIDVTCPIWPSRPMASENLVTWAWIISFRNQSDRSAIFVVFCDKRKTFINSRHFGLIEPSDCPNFNGFYVTYVRLWLSSTHPTGSWVWEEYLYYFYVTSRGDLMLLIGYFSHRNIGFVIPFLEITMMWILMRGLHRRELAFKMGTKCVGRLRNLCLLSEFASHWDTGRHRRLVWGTRLILCVWVVLSSLVDWKSGVHMNMADQLVDGPPAKRQKLGPSPTLTPTDNAGQYQPTFLAIKYEKFPSRQM